MDMDKIREALWYAGEAHGSQLLPVREKKLPYALHFSMVAMEVMAAAADLENPELAVVCAILHDTIEDAGALASEIAQRFGQDAADGVMALSKDKSMDKAAAMEDSLARLLLLGKSVQAVKLADRIVNLGPAPSHWSAQKKERYRDEAKLILEKLGGASPMLAARLAQKIEGYCKKAQPGI